VTIGYVDGSGLATILQPGAAGDRGAQIWRALDACCSNDLVEFEVPSSIGRSLNRVAWIWALNELTMVPIELAVRRAAIDLAWLGAPTLASIHVACAEAVGADHFLTSDETSASWAAIRGLDAVVLN
jgi:hypothetical protein